MTVLMKLNALSKNKDLMLLGALILLGGFSAYFDETINSHSFFIELIYTLILTIILGFCLACQAKYQEIKRFGWNKIVFGIVLLLFGSVMDILDDPPVIAFINGLGVAYHRDWEMGFLEKILGNTTGILIFAYGFFQWIPWMIETRMNVQRLNQRLSQTNQGMSRIMMSLDEHVESERLRISRELHDDVAQQLTFLNLQTQMCRKELAQAPEKAAERIRQIGLDLSETLKSVRQISRDLRPESLYALGFAPALEQFLEKLRQQSPEVQFEVTYQLLEDESVFDQAFDDRHRLHFFRLVQESVRNALKHSQARRIHVHFSETAQAFDCAIEDDGAGLPWQVMPTDTELVQGGHLGIVGMRERVKELGGELQLVNNAENTPNQPGACMKIYLPKGDQSP